MPLNPSPCDITGSFPEGPLHRGLPYHVLGVSKDVDTALIDVVQVADPEVEFQVSCIDGDAPGELKFALPPAMDPGQYTLSAQLIPKNDCPEGSIAAQTFDVE
jgi:hypothetical protein